MTKKTKSTYRVFAYNPASLTIPGADIKAKSAEAAARKYLARHDLPSTTLLNVDLTVAPTYVRKRALTAWRAGDVGSVPVVRSAERPEVRTVERAAETREVINARAEALNDRPGVLPSGQGSVGPLTQAERHPEDKRTFRVQYGIVGRTGYSGYTSTKPTVEETLAEAQEMFQNRIERQLAGESVLVPTIGIWPYEPGLDVTEKAPLLRWTAKADPEVQRWKVQRETLAKRISERVKRNADEAEAQKRDRAEEDTTAGAAVTRLKAEFKAEWRRVSLELTEAKRRARSSDYAAGIDLGLLAVDGLTRWVLTYEPGVAPVAGEPVGLTDDEAEAQN